MLSADLGRGQPSWLPCILLDLFLGRGAAWKEEAKQTMSCGGETAAPQ